MWGQSWKAAISSARVAAPFNSVTHARPAEGDNNTAKCVVCLQIMAKWGETPEVPVFKLIHRPEDA